jgi:trk system potassium uptake protein TrkH
MIRKFSRSLTRSQIIAMSFMAVILVGALLLTLPVSSRDGEWTPFINSLFTATSATCVTGLIVYDTYVHFSTFGQVVIMLLIQTGGIGLMTLVTTVTVLMRRKIGLQNRMLIMESAGTVTLSGIGHLVKRIVAGTLMFELAGAILLSTQMIPVLGFGRGIFASIFHSVSAFCNAGFDIMGQISPGTSLGVFYDNVVVNLTIMMLIIIGGIGFFVWSDVAFCKFKARRYELHTKLTLVTTGILIVLGWVLFFVFEYHHAFSDMPVPKKLLAALFQSVTPRTAGFATVDMNKLSESGSILTVLLMFIGGSPGSTAGGIKTTTIAVIFLSTLAYTQTDHDVTIFHYKIEEKMVRRASAIAFIYALMVLASTLVICAIEPCSMRQVFFEVVSAVGTVGLSMGITSSLSAISKLILITLMYAGRIGGLTFIVILSRKNIPALVTRPTGRIMIG